MVMREHNVSPQRLHCFNTKCNQIHNPNINSLFIDILLSLAIFKFFR